MLMRLLSFQAVAVCCATGNLTSNIDRFVRSEHRHPVAIFADYDSCFDILNPFVWNASTDGVKFSEQFFRTHKVVDKARAARKLLQDFLTQITWDREVYLFVGSSRQSLRFDLAMRKQPGTLSAIEGGGFEAIAKDTTWKKHTWKMNYALLADVGERDTLRWEKDTKGSAWIDATLRQPIEICANSPKTDDTLLKLMMVENNFLQLKREHGPVDVYFFDDKSDILDYTRSHARVPGHITFYTVHYDHMAYIVDGQKPETHPLICNKATPLANMIQNRWPRTGGNWFEFWTRVIGSSSPVRFSGNHFTGITSGPDPSTAALTMLHV